MQIINYKVICVILFEELSILTKQNILNPKQIQPIIDESIGILPMLCYTKRFLYLIPI